MRNAALTLGLIAGIVGMMVGFFGYGYTQAVARYGEIDGLAEQVGNVGLVRAMAVLAPLLAIAGGAMAKVRALWGGGLLVLSDTYYPGWQAYVDGEEQKILRANHVFRALAVPPTAQRVVFRYGAPSFTAGAWLSGAALGVFAFLLFWTRGQKMGDAGPLALEEKGWPGALTIQVVLIFVIHALVIQWPQWAQVLQRSRVLEAWGGG